MRLQVCDLSGKRLRRSWRLGFVALALIGLAATVCGQILNSPTPNDSSVVGRYNLVSAAGQNLPAVVSQNPSTGYEQEVTGGYIDLRSDKTCTVSTEYRYTEKGLTRTSSSRDEGAYAISGDTVTLTFGRDQLKATLTGDVLTVRADVELVYRKRRQDKEQE